MNKFALAFAAVVFAAMSIFNSSAEAGMRGKIGLGILGAAVIMGAAHSASKQHSRKRRAHRARRYRAQKRAVAKRSYKTNKTVAKKSTPTPKETSVAELPDEVEDEVQDVAQDEAQVEDSPVNKIAETEQSSISALDAEVAGNEVVKPEEVVAEIVTDTTAHDEPVAASNNDLGCKKFFPSVAMTLTVPCQ